MAEGVAVEGGTAAVGVLGTLWGTPLAVPMGGGEGVTYTETGGAEGAAAAGATCLGGDERGEEEYGGEEKGWEFEEHDHGCGW